VEAGVARHSDFLPCFAAALRIARQRKKAQFCHSERSEESLFDLKFKEIFLGEKPTSK
jgi:hypothetical protein